MLSSLVWPALLGCWPGLFYGEAIPLVGQTSNLSQTALTSTNSPVASSLVLKRHEGDDWFALPVLRFNNDIGFMTGAQFDYIDYGHDGRLPYEFFLEAKIRVSLKNRHEHRLIVDVPYLLGTKSRLKIWAELLSIQDANFFGPANFDVIDDPRSKHYDYQLFEPRIQTFWLLPLSKPRVVRPNTMPRSIFGMGIGITQATTSITVLPDTVLESLRPVGTSGGHGLIFMGLLTVDTRDDEIIPFNGVYAELYGKIAPYGLLNSFGFQGTGAQAAWFYSPFSFVVFAQRLMFEYMGGDVPFYEQNRIGGSKNVFGIGGVYSQRGYFEARFTGNTKAVVNTELRFFAPQMFKLVTLGLAPFIDLGAVFDKKPGINFFDRFKPAYGAELNIRWKDYLVVRFDYGFSSEGNVAYVEGQHLF